MTTNLDVLVDTLSAITASPADEYRRLICAGIESGTIRGAFLLSECPEPDQMMIALLALKREQLVDWMLRLGITIFEKDASS